MNTDCKLSVTISPVGYDNVWPRCRISFAGIVKDLVLRDETTFIFNEKIKCVENLVIEFYGKRNQDSINGRDLRIRIQDISIMGISDKKFINIGTYDPVYPEPWATQQIQKGIDLKKNLKNVDCLGWNGKWTLSITSPAFTFIHKVLDLGCIYPYSQINHS